MEAHDAAEHVQSAAEHDAAAPDRDTRFRNRVAIAIAIMATLLALTAMLGEDAHRSELNLNIDVVDTRSTLNLRTGQVQTAQLAIQAVQEQLASPALTDEQRVLLQQNLATIQAQLGRLQSNPGQQDGIRELQDHLNSTEHGQTGAAASGESYHLGEVLFQIAIVLASVAILIVNRTTLAVSLAVCGFALLLLLNGFMGIVRW
jgi:Domain of unknown function (DUF4337)